ncbi:LLM class flavin-dependent oxidoreductase [Oceanobacillus rekensis]|uniref:LLM class flavin-dependent oxidoreductase n=1 Tax=Oceanobacillus rekensis TaxID=937927 RepID=UPI000B4495DB|nr:LLM class flavin-dependent oxidoreductase [Oceanobacillus rekensis]
MKFGYFTLTDNPIEFGADRRDPNQYIKDVVEQGIYAEELGFNSVWLPEHHFNALGVLPSPSVALSYIAAKTKKIKLAPATVLLPANHPVRMAEEYALLDLLSDGRAIFSAGRGYDKREYDVFEIDFTKSREIFFEQLDIMKKAWTEEKFSYDGEFYKFPEIQVTPRPVQDPHVPIYVASFSRGSLVKAAEMGENVMFAPFAATSVYGGINEAVKEFKELSEKNGFKNKKAICSYFLNVTETAEETEATKKRMLQYFEGLVPAFPEDISKAPENIRYFAEIVDRLKTLETNDLGEESIIVGEVDYVVEALKKVEASGIEEVIIYFDFGVISHEETLKSMERFSKHVMPHFEKSKVTIG